MLWQSRNHSRLQLPKSSTITLSSVDAVTGLLTTYSVVDIYHKSIAITQAEDETDNHTDGTSASDAISGTNDINVHDVVHHQEKTLALVGTDANGVTYDLTETINREQCPASAPPRNKEQPFCDALRSLEKRIRSVHSNKPLAIFGSGCFVLLHSEFLERFNLSCIRQSRRATPKPTVRLR